MTTHRPHNYGFTLIELSIVLVIIGLIIGGVLVGRDLIEAAETRSTISQVMRYNTAINAFKLKYNCLPGDCANADALGMEGTGSSVGTGTNGNGDGRITTYGWMLDNQWPQSREATNLWMHLSKAGLVDGAFVGYTSDTNPSTYDGTYPKARLGRNARITFATPSIDDVNGTYGSAQWKNAFTLSGITTGTDTNPYAYLGAFQPRQAMAIDTKTDDGLPITGNTRILTSYSGPIVTVDYSGCNISPTNVYDVTNTSFTCSLAIAMQ